MQLYLVDRMRSCLQPRLQIETFQFDLTSCYKFRLYLYRVKCSTNYHEIRKSVDWHYVRR